jgi:3-methyladenine DNA glycosylase AlkD
MITCNDKVIHLPVYFLIWFKRIVEISLRLKYCSHYQRSLNTLEKWLSDMEGYVQKAIQSPFYTLYRTNNVFSLYYISFSL